jgi:hypothetical protein
VVGKGEEEIAMKELLARLEGFDRLRRTVFMQEVFGREDGQDLLLLLRQAPEEVAERFLDLAGGGTKSGCGRRWRRLRWSMRSGCGRPMQASRR